MSEDYKELEKAVETIRDYCEERSCRQCIFHRNTSEDPYASFDCSLSVVDPCDWILEEEQ